MGIFCKLFERDMDQVLVRKGLNDDGLPSVIYEFKLNEEMDAAPAVAFKDTEKGWAARDAMFETCTADQAWAVVDEIKKDFGGRFFEPQEADHAQN